MYYALKMALTWLAGLTALTLLDLLWIGVVASGFYRKHIGHLLDIGDEGMRVRFPAALATWAVMVTGIYVFVLSRESAGNSPIWFMIWGGLFGFFVYAIYDLTNLAVLRDWPVSATVVDIAWGTFLCCVVALVMGAVRQQLDRML